MVCFIGSLILIYLHKMVLQKGDTDILLKRVVIYYQMLLCLSHIGLKPFLHRVILSIGFQHQFCKIKLPLKHYLNKFLTMTNYVFLVQYVIPFYVLIVLINKMIGLFLVCSLGIVQYIKVLVSSYSH